MSTADNLVDTLGEGTDPIANIAAIAKELSEFLIKQSRKKSELIPSYLEYVTRIAEAAIKSGCMSLHDICILYQERLHALAEGDKKIGAKERGALTLWPDLILAFVNSTSQRETGNALVEHLNLPCWNSRLSDIDVEVLKAMFNMPDDSVPVSQEIDSTATKKASGIDVSSSSAKSGGIISAGVQELVDILITGLADMKSQLQVTLKIATDADIDPDKRSAEVETLAHQLTSFGEASVSIGFSGLEQVCSHIRSNITVFCKEQMKPETAAVLTNWYASVLTYLKSITDPDAAASLAVVLVDPAWPQPLTGEAAESLSLLLAAPELPGFEEAEGKQQLQAKPEDVSLELPDDVDPELLEALLQELPGQTERFSAAIQNLNNGGSLEDINIAQRVAHTLKGAGNTVGVRGMANIAHRLEDILLALAKHETLPPRPLAEMMLNAADCLEAMSEALAGIGSAPDNAMEILQTILDWANQIEREGIPADIKPPSTGTDKTGRSAASDPRKKQGVAVTGNDQQESDKAAEPMLRIPAALVDDLLRNVGEKVILTGQIHERLRRITQQSHDMQEQYSSLQQLGARLEELIDVKDMSAIYQRQQRDPDFDPLEMDQYSELHTTTRRLIEAATDIHVMGRGVMDQLRMLDDMVAGQIRLNRESQEAVLKTRMVPAQTILPRLQRSVRQTCNATKKKVNLHLSGGETLIASDVLNDMVDSLMHILRNAVDHGIEDAATRADAGKPADGNITLEFQREGNQIVVRVQDDGSGLDLNGIRHTAEECGLLVTGQKITDEELINMILKPNFSTRTKTTQISGRGIGMDAVHTRVMELGGILNIKSESGRGCLIEMKLPVSLISTHALLVRVGPHIVAIANHGVQQILYSGDGKFCRNGGEPVFQMGENTYTVKFLASLLNIQERRSASRQDQPIIVVQTQERIYAFPVENVIDSRDLVVKELGKYVPKLHGVLGATILGDGSVTSVLDLPELLRDPRTQTGDATAATGADTGYDLPLALVVDDSLSARRTLSKFLQDSGYKVRMARDGIEAIDILKVLKPNILLVDMEMPRMNGIELTAHVRSHELTADLPIIMVTSRSTSKHRHQAEQAGVNAYFTKPFTEEELLEKIEQLKTKD